MAAELFESESVGLVGGSIAYGQNPFGPKSFDFQLKVYFISSKLDTFPNSGSAFGRYGPIKFNIIWPTYILNVDSDHIFSFHICFKLPTMCYG